MRRLVAVAGVGALALLAPAAATAAPAKPVATTGGASSVGQSSALLNGFVNPRRAVTTYFFQVGTTRLYGATSTSATASGNRRVRVTTAISGLAPFTTYHYRLVAQNSKGLVFGKDRTFRTRRQPLGLTLAATPNPVSAGRSSTLGGALTGTGNGGRQVVLQANPFPYTQGFVNVSNVQVTNSDGSFAFPILSVPVTTQYRVLMPQRPEVVSPIAVLGASVRVSLSKRIRRGENRGRVRFFGSISPAVDGQQVLVQKFRDGAWRTIGRTFARDNGSSSSRYTKLVRPTSGGRFRVVANVEGAYVPTASRTTRIRRVRD